MRASVERIVADLTPRITGLRHLLHRNPEPSNQEFRTTEILAETLSKFGLDPRVRATGTGLLVDIGEPRIGFRADIDALPIDEPEGNDPRSGNPGWMHACGHDAHAAVAAGIAIGLSRLEGDGGYRIFFQPAEEAIVGGAVDLVAEGVVDGLEAVMAFHVDPTLDPGHIGVRHGPITAAADGFTVVLEGPGGHTSRPHRTVDLIAAAGKVITDLPPVIRSAFDARQPVVTAFGAVHGGEAPNVIPTRVELRGTIRSLHPEVRAALPELVKRTVARIAEAHGAVHTVTYRQGVPPVVNDPAVADAFARATREALGDGTVVPVETSMGGEDFAYYLDRVPGAMFRLGVRCGGGDIHSAGFKLDDAAVPVGVTAGIAAMAALARG
ncbi:MAG: amidohydrolase [Actinomycetes bacterium]|jgi:amidohydrolase|nr:MAG: amidohydrolase [Actinomycetota bacterium]